MQSYYTENIFSFQLALNFISITNNFQMSGAHLGVFAITFSCFRFWGILLYLLLCHLAYLDQAHWNWFLYRFIPLIKSTAGIEPLSISFRYTSTDTFKYIFRFGWRHSLPLKVTLTNSYLLTNWRSFDVQRCI